MFFLLIAKQAEVIRNGTGYNVGHYCGEMGQDFWDARRWQREFETKQVRLKNFSVEIASVFYVPSCKFD